MKIRKIFSLVLVFLSMASISYGYNVELLPAMSAKKYDDLDAEYGLSVHSHWTFYKGTKGYFTNVLYRGHWTAPDVILGYGYRSTGNYYYEFGGGFRYSGVGGPGIGVLFSLGMNLVGTMYLSLPFVYRSGGLGGLTYIPHIGFKF